MTNAIGTNEIGPSFGTEIIAAGLGGAPFSWGPDGTFVWAEALSDEQKASVEAVYAAHDPSNADPNAAYHSARLAGVVVTSASTASLDATYGCSEVDQANMTTMQGLVGLGVFPGWFKDISGQKIAMSSAQFSALATGIARYVLALDAARDAGIAGGGKWIAPAPAVSID